MEVRYCDGGCGAVRCFDAVRCRDGCGVVMGCSAMMKRGVVMGCSEVMGVRCCDGSAVL